MGRWKFLFLFLPLGLVALAQEVPTYEEFQISDLQLVSHQAVLQGTDAFTGPTCAAIVLAWFADHGFRGLLPDLTGDGVIDEEDTVALARRLARAMRVTPERGAPDPLLVDALARYVAERYPDQFVIKIFDDSFEKEYLAVVGKPFDPSLYPDIAFELRRNPTRDDYAAELLAAEGVILGIGRERSINRFFVGRSFRLEAQPGGWPVDVVDTSDDPAQEGLQGQVFPTYLREAAPHWLFAYGGWQPFEFMLSLSPTRLPAAGEVEHACAPGAFGYDVTTVETDHGTFEVEECAVREGDRDLYYYTVRNIDFLYNGCGICEFFIPNTAGFPTLAQWGPPGWLLNVWFPAGWLWTAPAGDCGIMPGSSAVFGFAVPAPTTDVPQPAAVSTCIAGASPTHLVLPEVAHFKFTTTGPAAEEVGCPDLTITDTSGCWYTSQNRFIVRVSAWVKNIGTATATDVEVCFEADGASKTISAGTLSPGTQKKVTVGLDLGYKVIFPITVKIEVDCEDEIDECKELNNDATVRIYREDQCR